jgi:hypothetical protein
MKNMDLSDAPSLAITLWVDRSPVNQLSSGWVVGCFEKVSQHALRHHNRPSDRLNFKWNARRCPRGYPGLFSFETDGGQLYVDGSVSEGHLLRFPLQFGPSASWLVVNP